MYFRLVVEYAGLGIRYIRIVSRVVERCPSFVMFFALPKETFRNDIVPYLILKSSLSGLVILNPLPGVIVRYRATT